MKNLLLPVLGLAAAIGSTSMAHAAPLTCTLSYNVKGGGLQIGLGYYELKGRGRIHCMDQNGQIHTRKVNVSIGGDILAPRVGIGYSHIYGDSASFGINGSMDDLYGHYLLADAQAAVGLGAGAQFSVQSPLSGLRMSLGITGSYGLGAETGVSMLTISPR